MDGANERGAQRRMRVRSEHVFKEGGPRPEPSPQPLSRRERDSSATIGRSNFSSPWAELGFAHKQSPTRTLGQQPAQFHIGQIAPLTDLQCTQLDIDNAHAAQLGHAIAKFVGHQANLPV